MLGFRYFSEREAEILYKRVMIDDPSKAHSKRSVSWPELRSALGNYLLIDAGRNARFAMLTLSTAFSFPWHPVNGAWVSANAKSAGERSITMAILIMAANCSGIVGLTTAAAACGIWANVQYYILNKRKLNRTGLSYQY
ncbi:hypothetical protein COL5a_009968 [Colletotrichum fioriniae]|uniref:uncharacterized protein n=1 Tax=Colletotrichum fioriniae TaxID=710243 RepID=UPI0032D9E676|nr:hypothetical protein COL5a_009968 [Colletotrichum fioriniae]KAJ3938053.1 hypothetical protein N0V96_012053 [Colletotrichum fioriniae]